MSGAEPAVEPDRVSLCRIEATEAATEALRQLRAEHGDILLHLPGGAEDAGTPMCLAVGELRIGAYDVYLGSVDGVDLFEQRARPGAHHRDGWVATLDVVPGRSPGFSLPPGEGRRFAMRDTRA